MSRYYDQLPAVLQEGNPLDPTPPRDQFLGRFLLAFEEILTGFGASPPKAPEEVLDAIHTYVDPKTAPAEFLPWLASWVATSLREDWSIDTRRSFIARVVPLYRRRGTPFALKKLLQIYLSPDDPDSRTDVQIIERAPQGQPAFPPRYFQVRFTIRDRDVASLGKQAAIAADLIDREKPAHTFYGLLIDFPSLEIANPPSLGSNGQPDYKTGVFVGVNTVLGGGFYKP